MTRWVIKPAQSEVLEQLRKTTTARIGTGRAGERPPTAAWLKFREDHALARDAVKSEFGSEFLSWAKDQGFPLISSLAIDKQDYIAFPPKGKKTDEATLAQLKNSCP